MLQCYIALTTGLEHDAFRWIQDVRQQASAPWSTTALTIAHGPQRHPFSIKAKLLFQLRELLLKAFVYIQC